MKVQQYLDISTWQNKTFGKATALSKIAHLIKELQELIDDLQTNNPNKKLEFADCFILLFGAAASDNMSYKDICDAINEKMQINYKRKWGKPNKAGIVEHIKP